MKKFVLLLGVILPSLLSLPISAEPALTQSVQNDQAKTITLEEFKGKVVYVDFWASWCGPCRKSFPWMNAMHAKYENQGLAVVAINLDSDKALADKFLSLLPAKFHIRFDPEGDAAAAFDLQGMPSSYIFNKQGELVQTHVGFFEEYVDQYEQELVTLLKE